ncbi:hypothetical protein [Methanogenium marinum]|nr:hypothetical protein [Methanogenium marinum]
MIVVGEAVGAALLVLWFRGVHENYLKKRESLLAYSGSPSQLGT